VILPARLLQTVLDRSCA